MIMLVRYADDIHNLGIVRIQNPLVVDNIQDKHVVDNRQTWPKNIRMVKALAQ